VWGLEENRPEPALRTHAGIIAQGLASARSLLKWDDDAHPRKDQGVDGECPLAKVPLFDLVWDVCMDFMHIVKVLLGGHLIPLLRGKRALKPPKVCQNLDNDPEVSRLHSPLSPVIVSCYYGLTTVMTGHFYWPPL
jgi:hypothetical protein